MHDPLQRRILFALFALCRDTLHVSAATLADAAETTPTRAAHALCALERAGLCDASRARLTMLGLATAVRLGCAGGGGRTRKRRSGGASHSRSPDERRPHPKRSELPLAALPSRPPSALHG